MQKGLISVLTPAYNAGSFITRLLDSILMQDYHSVEMIVVDDGSTDNTKDVVCSFIPKFLQKGYTLSYYYQSNAGQSTAIRNGLKHVNGEFLIWPDSDDFYSDSSAFSGFVEEFVNRSDINVVRCLPRYLDENSLVEVSKVENTEKYYKENLFEDCVFGRGAFFWGAGNYMIRMSYFDNCIPNRDIYVEKSAGQNWQLLVPMFYKQQCLTIPRYFLNILVRSSSHSRGQFAEYGQSFYIQGVYERTIIATVNQILQMPESYKKSLINSLELYYIKKRMTIAVNYKNPSDAVRYMKEFKAKGGDLSLLRQIYCFCCANSLAIFVNRLYQKVCHLFLNKI